MTDLLVLGSGIAGLTAALGAADIGASVVVLTKGDLAHSATWYAQGGVAAALGPLDSPDLHMRDTLTAGSGLSDREAVRILVDEGPARLRELAALGARFDSDGESWHLTREGGHSLARVVHAGGDATGAEIERALVDSVLKQRVDVRERWFVVDLLVENGHCVGAVAVAPGGEPLEVRASDTVLATGGAGQCFAVTTNPILSTGDGLAAALRVGAACADLEFVQFHPTALAVDAMPRPLLSEALRGEGAVLRDLDGKELMATEHPLGDLAPRDVVSRAVHRRMLAADADHVWLDATRIDGFAARFPTIDAACREVSLDAAVDWLPVAPAAHYLSGGVLADLDGATTVPHLWACGEAACSGVHGANRLASNSLLDGLVFGRRVVEAIAAGKSTPEATGALQGVIDGELDQPNISGRERPGDETGSDPASRDRGAGGATARRERLQRAMSRDCGVVRDAAGLKRVARVARQVGAETAPASEADTSSQELVNLAQVASAIVDSATNREESRGTHTRADHPDANDAFIGRFVLRRDARTRFVPLSARDAGARS